MSRLSRLDDYNYYGDHRVRARDAHRDPYDPKLRAVIWSREECTCLQCEARRTPFVLRPVFEYVPLIGYHQPRRAWPHPTKLWTYTDADGTEVSSGNVRHNHVVMWKDVVHRLTGAIVARFAVDRIEIDRSYGHESASSAAEELLLRLNEGRVDAPEDYGTHEILLRIRLEVCPTCNGEGHHVNPSIDAGGIGQDDEFWDDDYDEDGGSLYMSGAYDVTCYGCDGERVVPVVDEDANDPEILAEYFAHLRSMADMDAEMAAERRMGA